MASLVLNKTPGFLPMPAIYGGVPIQPGGKALIQDTPANVLAAFGSPKAGVLAISQVPDGQAGAIQPDSSTPKYFLGRQLITATGTYTPSIGCNRVRVRMVGGGGGGGGVAASSAGQAAAGAGGASGSYFEKYIDPGAAITGGAATVGAAGTAGASTGAAGGAGGDTSIVIQGVTYTAKGGPGGGFTGSSASNQQSQGGGFVAGTSAGDVGTGQEPGGAGQCFGGTIATSGFGGSSPWGAGGAHSIAVGAGNPGQGNGGGGSGGISINASAAVAGGAGTIGLIIIDEYT